MTYVVYEGTADFKVLDANDLKKAGVEGFKKTTFERGVPVQINDDAAEALASTEADDFFHDEPFAVVEEEDVDQVAEELRRPEPVTATAPPPPGTGGSTPDGSTGRGVSSRSSTTTGGATP